MICNGYMAQKCSYYIWLLVVVYRKLWACEILSGFQSIESKFQSRAGGMEYEMVSFSIELFQLPYLIHGYWGMFYTGVVKCPILGLLDITL